MVDRHKKIVLTVTALALVASVALLIWRHSEVYHTEKDINEACSTDTWQERRERMVITPTIEGLFGDDPALEARLRALLDTLEPGGPSGRVQVGYTTGIDLLSLYREQDGAWQLDLSRLQQQLDMARRIGRPVVIHLRGNHFASVSPLAKVLAKDPANLMTYQDGRIADGRYFESTLLPFTLLTDHKIPVNTYRFQALREAAKLIGKFNEDYPGLLVAVALNGETHHLFEDLRNGTGSFAGIKITDYSPAAQEQFRVYLRQKGWDLDRLNAVFGTSFSSWPSVFPPAREEKSAEVWEYFDSYARGTVPIYGWVTADGGVEPPKIFLDQCYIGDATYGVNRMDVYDAVPAVTTPNVGFRFDLDYSTLPSGDYLLQVIVKTKNNGVKELGRRNIKIVNAFAPEPADVRCERLSKLPEESKNVAGYVDGPTDSVELRFNPLAALWEEFREEQVISFVENMASIAAGAGLDKKYLFSYQSQPWLYGGWNDVLFAASDAILKSQAMRPGLTLYGGITMSDLPYRSIPGLAYGVPEFHPLMGKDVCAPYASLVQHFNRGAVFVSPYYMSILHTATGLSEHQQFLIGPGNRQRGSDHLYNAIRAMPKH